MIARDGGGTQRAHVAFSYAKGGKDQAILQTRTSHQEEGITGGAVTSYGYDSINRLIAAREVAGGVQKMAWAYAYDKAGNRTMNDADSNGAKGLLPGGRQTVSYNAANQITAKTATGAWGYDAAGNETRNGATGLVTTYGERGQVSATGSQAMAHFGSGSQRTWQMGTTNFALSPLGTTTHNAAGLLVRTLRTPDGAVLGAKTNANEYYVADQVGSVIGRFDAAGSWKGGASYDPYGQTRFTSGTSVGPWAFTGGYQHSATSYKLGARFYDVSTARFTQMDPTGQETNPYLYAAGSPCTNTDPTGTFTVTNCRAFVSRTSIAAGAAGTAIGTFIPHPAARWGGFALGVYSTLGSTILPRACITKNIIVPTGTPLRYRW